MNKAILMAQAALLTALFMPGLNAVLGLHVHEIHAWGWFLAIMGALACLVMCETYKIVSSKFIAAAEMANYDARLDGVKASDVRERETLPRV